MHEKPRRQESNVILSNQSMSCKQSLKEFFLKCDIFSTSEFLRYDNQPEYRTYTGAFCSIVTVISFCAIFMNVMIGTFAKTEIVWSLNNIQESVDSFKVTTDTRGAQKFMFAVSISGTDFRNSSQYFDVILLLKKSENSTNVATVSVQLQPCTLQHWSVNEDIMHTYQRMNFSKMLCPPIGLSIPLQGKFTSQLFQYAEITITKCSNATNSSKICLDTTPILNKIYHFDLFILNTLINPNSPQYLTYYLQDRNFLAFTTTSTANLVSIFISNYQITTDQSIWPVSQKREEAGAIISNLGQVVPYPTNTDTFATMVLRRSSTAVIVERGFKKIDETLSYIGGLFGFVVILLLFMKEYTEYSFELDASSHLYHVESQSSVPSFNLFVFVGYLFFILLDGIGLTPDWKNMKAIDQSREEIQKQLDVRFLFQRINFVQNSLRMLFNEEQAKILHLRRKPTLKEASQLRQNYLAKKIIKGQNGQEVTENPFNNSEETFSVAIGQRSNKVIPEQGQQSRRVASKMKNSIKLLRNKTLNGDHLSKKIIDQLDPNIVKIIFQTNQQHSNHQQKEQENNSNINSFDKSHRQKSNKRDALEFQHPSGQVQNSRKRKGSHSVDFQYIN